MTEEKSSYQVLPFPHLRQLIVDAGRFAVKKHTIRGLLEIDVTAVRQHIREHRERTGETLSFTAYVIACLGQAVASNRQLHAYRNWRNQLVVFDAVDVLTYVEVEFEGQKFPLAHIIRAVDQKTWREIHDEIRTVQSDPQQSPNARRQRAVEWFLMLPRFARDIFYGAINRSPQVWKKNAGTVYLTSVGMFGSGGGWGIGYSAHTLGLVIGGIGEKPVVRDGRIEIRECLHVTADFDHDVVDGAPAARFLNGFSELLESGLKLAEGDLPQESSG